MKKVPHPVVTILLTTALFFSPACSKVREYIEQHPSDIGKYCRIDSFVVNDLFAGLQHFQFRYDAAGNPIEIRQDGVQYGEDLHLRYDKKGRLSDVLQTDPGQTFVYIWTRYTYPSSRVIIDSVFNYQGNVTDPNPPRTPGSTVTITKMQLDEEGRPVKFQTYYTDPGIPSGTYDVSYDRNGNLIVPGLAYDDKVNIYQTNKAWQLIYGDYSRNNPTAPQPRNGPGLPPVTPASYNAYGLPTIFQGPFRPIFGFTSYVSITASYSCDVASPTTAY